MYIINFLGKCIELNISNIKFLHRIKKKLRKNQINWIIF